MIFSSKLQSYSVSIKRYPFSEFLAFTDNLIAETEQLTHAIKLLLTDAQYGQLQARAPDHAYSVCFFVFIISINYIEFIESEKWMKFLFTLILCTLTVIL